MKKISLKEMLILIANTGWFIEVIDHRTGKTLCEGNVVELYLRNKAEKFFKREVLCITRERWNGGIYPSSELLIIVEEWEVE